jgi:hypothetical protein
VPIETVLAEVVGVLQYEKQGNNWVKIEA